ncbi:MAG TPA: hypothetical protein VN643_16020 [Pyrinomonadaceae bacterium]|nr:hypothetical protein [Pyrinomonadaceae bacterium]
MFDLSTFEDAVVSFQRFLNENDHPADIFWVFRDDVWKRSATDVLIKYPVSDANRLLAKKVFEEGRKRGLVEIQAVATAGDKVAATVWFPKFPGEEVQGWDCGMKLSIAEPLLRAKTIGALGWWTLSLLPGSRRYQIADTFIATRNWAAAASPTRGPADLGHP